jgi:hypothetical protein
VFPDLSVPSASIHLAPSGPWAVLLFVLLAALALEIARRAYRNTQPAVMGWRRGTLTVLRAGVLLLLLFLLAEPVLHRQQERTTPPGVLLLVDDSGSMGIEDDAGTARLIQARHLRDRIAERLMARGGGLRVFQGEGSRSLRRDGEGLSGEGTNLPALLLSAAQRHVEDNLQAIVLFSDGVSTDQEVPSLAGLQVPVWAVAVGDTAGAVDLRLDRVRYPSLAYRGEEIEIQAEVVVEDPRAGSAWVRRRGPDGVDSLRVDWPAGGGRIPVRFVVPADSLGLRRGVLRVEERPEEGLTANNAVQLGIEVRKERLHVVLIQSRPGWDFHFLRRRLAQDPRFRCDGVYRAETGWVVAGADSVWVPPGDREAAEGVDAWIVGSLDDLGELARIAPGIGDSVEGGSGLLVLFGEARRRTPAPLPAAANRLLPVVLGAQARWAPGQYRALPTTLGRGHPVLALASSPDVLDEPFAQLPPLWELVQGVTARDDADVLLTAQSGDGSWPLLVLGHRGQGTVAAFTGAPLWSWSFWRLGAQGGGEVYEAVVGNLLYHLAEGAAGGRLRLLLPRTVVARGEDALLRAVVLDPRLQPDDSGEAWLEWRTASTDSTAEAEGRARMDLDPRTPGGRRLSLPPLPAGRYELRLALEERGERLTSPWQSLVVDPYSVEYQRPGVDRASLQRMARVTGGRLLDGSLEADAWSEDVSLSPKSTVRTSRFALWSSLPLFLAFLALLSLEWILRKRWGLI